MFYVSSYYLVQEKASAYRQWLLSDEAKGLFADLEREIGMRYRGTYWTVLNFGDYDCENWWELPNWAALDALRTSEAGAKLHARFAELGFEDVGRGSRARVLRTTDEVKVTPSKPPEG